MRQSVIIAKTGGGQWLTLAQADVPVNEQDAYLKQLRGNGGVIELNGELVKLEEAQQLLLGSGKKAKFKQEVEPAPKKDDGVKNLNDLQAALGIENKKEFDALRKTDGFPGEKDEAGCFDVEACQRFMVDRIVSNDGEEVAMLLDVEPQVIADALAMDSFPEPLEGGGWLVGDVRAFLAEQENPSEVLDNP